MFIVGLMLTAMVGYGGWEGWGWEEVILVVVRDKSCFGCFPFIFNVRLINYLYRRCLLFITKVINIQPSILSYRLVVFISYLLYWKV